MVKFLRKRQFFADIAHYITLIHNKQKRGDHLLSRFEFEMGIMCYFNFNPTLKLSFLVIHYSIPSLSLTFLSSERREFHCKKTVLLYNDFSYILHYTLCVRQQEQVVVSWYTEYVFNVNVALVVRALNTGHSVPVMRFIRQIYVSHISYNFNILNAATDEIKKLLAHVRESFSYAIELFIQHVTMKLSSNFNQLLNCL